MKPAFPDTNKSPYEGPSSKNPLAFKQRLAELAKNRYASWDSGIGASIEAGKEDFASLEKYTMSRPDPFQHGSGRQELFESIVNELI